MLSLDYCTGIAGKSESICMSYQIRVIYSKVIANNLNLCVTQTIINLVTGDN